MSIVGICCNKELGSSCIYCCDNRYCINTEAVTFNQIDMSCSGYVNKDILRNVLKNLEEIN